jgi:hypothetical protein
VEVIKMFTIIMLVMDEEDLMDDEEENCMMKMLGFYS